MHPPQIYPLRCGGDPGVFCGEDDMHIFSSCSCMKTCFKFSRFSVFCSHAAIRYGSFALHTSIFCCHCSIKWPDHYSRPSITLSCWPIFICVIVHRAVELPSIRRYAVPHHPQDLAKIVIQGNKTSPNGYSVNLLENIGKFQGDMPVIRVGGNSQLVKQYLIHPLF